MKGLRVAGLWLLLLALFFGFRLFFANNGESVSTSSSEWVSILSGWGPFVFVFLAFFGFFWFRQRKYAPTYEAQRLLFQGRYAPALELFEKYRAKYPKEAVGAFNVGTTRLVMWRLGGAKLELEAAKNLARGKLGDLAALLPEHLALTHALLGNVGEARRAMAEVPADKGDPGRINLVLGILLVREGEWRQAREKLASFEVKQMAGIGAFARALDAMCIEKLSGERRHVDRLAVFGVGGADELAKAWPEFAAFVARAPEW